MEDCGYKGKELASWMSVSQQQSDKGDAVPSIPVDGGDRDASLIGTGEEQEVMANGRC